MAARYLVRLDDACPTMRRERWDPLERAMDSMDIKPIVGVIPDNRDPRLFCSSPDPHFWDRVRCWQQKGWSIAMHGLHHVYHPHPAGAKALLTIQHHSEFVGVSLEQQQEMIRHALEIFNREGVKPRLFMAPSHSFDANTLHALEEETDVRMITDGHALAPYRDGTFIWLPQQLWRFRSLPLGVWSVCLHPNVMSETELTVLLSDLSRYRSAIVDAANLNSESIPHRDAINRLFGYVYPLLLRLKRMF